MALDIHLYNTLGGKKELFKPLKKGFVGMYHCGPTVYWNQHIGNMRAVVMADIIRRTFLYNGYEIDFVRNYTDVGHLTGDNIGDADQGEDRMEKAAKREHLSPDLIADKYIKAFERDINLLNVMPPTHAPRATAFIADMIAMVQTLIDKGFAYQTHEAIYFDVSKFPGYARLSGQKADRLEAGEGHGSVGGESKRNARDFSLWFFKTGAHANALQTWDSPWGVGFPGWHIECSAMSKHFLGLTFDIHMGGIEHVPIHHTNEIAQSECANGVKYVDYWLHNEHLVVDAKKMAKSDGTSYLLQDIIDRGYSPLALRYLFLQAHYRSKQNFTWESLDAADKALKKLKAFASKTVESGTVSAPHKDAFLKFINDDFNVSGALASVWEMTKDSSLSDADARATILDFDRVLGLGLGDLDIKVREEVQVTDEVKMLVDERTAARNAKDWKKSDTLRDKIAALGYEVKDTPEGQKVLKR